MIKHGRASSIPRGLSSTEELPLMPTTLSLKTNRMELIAGTAELVRAHLSNQERFGLLLDAIIPRLSPPTPDAQEVMECMAQALDRGPDQVGWWCWYFVLREGVIGHRLLIGDGGFKGPPDTDGMAEIGYSVLRSQRNQGYATEAVTALVEWTSEHPEVRRIIAETKRTNAASMRVLEKIGFIQMGRGSEQGLLRFEITP
jgi:ribosomal-protein-alanine N-acetyltransferase